MTELRDTFELHLSFANCEDQPQLKHHVLATLGDLGVAPHELIEDFVDGIIDSVDDYQIEPKQLPVLVFHPQRKHLEAIKDALEQLFPKLVCSIRLLPAELWSQVWSDAKADGFKLSSLTIELCDELPEALESHTIYLKRGEAFGDGRHVSTRAIAGLLLERLSTRKFKAALDVGTGNGILAVLMGRVGVAKIVATDLSEEILDEARWNLRANEIATPCEFVCSHKIPEGSFDLVCINILAPELAKLLPDAVQRMEAGAELLLSGFNRDDARYLWQLCQKHGLELLAEREEHFWVAGAFRKKP